MLSVTVPLRAASRPACSCQTAGVLRQVGGAQPAHLQPQGPCAHSARVRLLWAGVRGWRRRPCMPPCTHMAQSAQQFCPLPLASLIHSLSCLIGTQYSSWRYSSHPYCPSPPLALLQLLGATAHLPGRQGGPECVRRHGIGRRPVLCLALLPDLQPLCTAGHLQQVSYGGLGCCKGGGVRGAVGEGAWGAVGRLAVSMGSTRHPSSPSKRPRALRDA